jgi:hypothetical protein
MPLPIQTFTIHVLMTTIVNQHVEGNERSNKQHIEHVNLLFSILD